MDHLPSPRLVIASHGNFDILRLKEVAVRWKVGERHRDQKTAALSELFTLGFPPSSWVELG